MTEEYDYGPLRTYEITWRDRPPEMVQGHQVLFDSARLPGLFGSPPADPGEPKFHIHGMFPCCCWRLMVAAREADVICIRDVTEQVAELEAMAAGETS